MVKKRVIVIDWRIKMEKELEDLEMEEDYSSEAVDLVREFTSRYDLDKVAEACRALADLFDSLAIWYLRRYYGEKRFS